MPEITDPDLFRLTTPCVDCPFRREGGVRHGAPQGTLYAACFVSDPGSIFPCHLTVPATLDRTHWTAWQPGQAMCAGGIAFAMNAGAFARWLCQAVASGACRLSDFHGARSEVFDTVIGMVAAHGLTGGGDDRRIVEP